MEIAYAAVTEGGTFMLDERGVCRWAVAGRDLDGSKSKVPDRIVGAQFVATLDLESEQGLAALPKVGAPMLFAVVDASGHISLVRTAKLVRWEDKRPGAEAPTPPTPPSAYALPLTRPPNFHSTPKPPPLSPPSDPVVRRSSLPPPPPRTRSDVAPKAGAARNNFAPPPAPPKTGPRAMGPLRVPTARRA